jgi:hypothetical protein
MLLDRRGIACLHPPIYSVHEQRGYLVIHSAHSVFCRILAIPQGKSTSGFWSKSHILGQIQFELLRDLVNSKITGAWNKHSWDCGDAERMVCHLPSGKNSVATGLGCRKTYHVTGNGCGHPLFAIFHLLNTELRDHVSMWNTCCEQKLVSLLQSQNSVVSATAISIEKDRLHKLVQNRSGVIVFCIRSSKTLEIPSFTSNSILIFTREVNLHNQHKNVGMSRLKMGYTPNYSHLVGIMIINHWV